MPFHNIFDHVGRIIFFIGIFHMNQLISEFIRKGLAKRLDNGFFIRLAINNAFQARQPSAQPNFLSSLL